jgi:glycerol-3-phosphate dehydrogenase (NAD(P)+)
MSSRTGGGGPRAAVMGSGSWGTAFGMVLADAGCDVVLWGHDPKLAAEIDTTHENSRYHPGVALPPQLRASGDPRVALDGADFVVLALPAQVLRENLVSWLPDLPAHAVLVSLMKGIELGSMQRMSQVVREATGVAQDRVAVISGPNLAGEIVQRQPAATVVACTAEETAARLQAACTTRYFRPYTNLDVVGAEVGGSVKNVIALASGMAAGMGFGENTQAAIITRGLAEMMRFGLALGANATTFFGLAGTGDLVATCSSPLSRNRTFGENLGRGMSMAEATAAMKQTCEGVKSCGPILELAHRHGVDMPITEQVVATVHDGRTPSEVVAALMSRDPKSEHSTM